MAKTNNTSNVDPYRQESPLRVSKVYAEDVSEAHASNFGVSGESPASSADEVDWVVSSSHFVFGQTQIHSLVAVAEEYECVVE